MNRKASTGVGRASSPAAADAPGDPVTLLWPMSSLGLAWMNMCLEIWGAYLEQWSESAAKRPPGSSVAADRRDAGMPWLPQFASTVVPLHRREDAPAGEADKLSVRLRVPALPWGGGGSVIAIDTLVPRSGPATAAPPTRH